MRPECKSAFELSSAADGIIFDKERLTESQMGFAVQLVERGWLALAKR